MTTTATHWVLDGLTGWRTESTDDVAVGAQLTLTETEGRYATSGTWISAALDGALPRCQWHRIELHLDSLPAGTAVDLATFTAEDANIGVGTLPADAWSPQPRLAGAVPLPGQRAERIEDLLVQSPPGRYMWIRVGFAGDGYGTPAVRQLIAHYPRSSYLRYLPAVFGVNDAARSFLERFLSIPQTEWDSVRERISTIARYFDPRAVPDDALAYLGSWLDAEFEPEWAPGDRRRLLCLLPGLRGVRGTARAVRETTRMYLRSIVGEAADAFRYPYLIEGFRERQWLTLASDAQRPPIVATGQSSREGRVRSRRLWSADVVRRLQVGGTARAGHSRLVSLGEPSSDMFALYAHRVRALAPAGWVRTAAQQRMLERGLRLELPANVAATVTLLDPYFQTGVQSTLGVDTVAGPGPDDATRVRSSSPRRQGPRAGPTAARTPGVRHRARASIASFPVKVSAAERRSTMTHSLRTRPGAPALERNHWFDYKYIGAQDLVAEQDYLISRHRAHNRLLHGCGVVCGLEVKQHPRAECAAGWVVVAAGIAVDAMGCELILAEDTPQQLPVAPGQAASFIVCLRYREERVQEVPILYADPEVGQPGSEANRIRESVEIVTVAANEFEPDGWEVGGPGCIEPAPATRNRLVPLALADVHSGGDPVTITNQPRRIGLPAHRPARIVDLSWEHGGSLTIRALREDRCLKVIFDRPLAAAQSRARGIGPDTFSVTYERGEDPPRRVLAAAAPSLSDGDRTAVFEIASEALSHEHEGYLGGSLVRVVLRCDFILDCDGLPVSGRHIGGRLPTGDRGVGGTFESWFQVTDAPSRASRREERGEEKEDT